MMIRNSIVVLSAASLLLSSSAIAADGRKESYVDTNKFWIMFTANY